ncbi:MAG TPA: DUF3097 domain-containing protein [Kribbella sp.]|nr:DUF3097 domain-containing protein [Kribbella sp.]
MTDRYGPDVLSGDWRKPRNGRTVELEVSRGLVVEEPTSGFVGAVVRWEHGVVDLEDRHGKIRTFPLGPGFWVDGKPVALKPPAKAAPAAKTRTASGSVAVAGVRARVARAGRIYVDGRHDAELVEKVWGDDLRIEGVVVEYLEGVDDLPGIVNSFQPGPGRRLGVLVDHLVAGSKESKIAAQVKGTHVLVVGHPFIDIWEAVKPSSLGIAAWPRIPHGQSWKHGILEAFGWPATSQADVAAAWKHILSKVNSYADLEPALLGRVEELIDFVTQD